MKSLSKLLFVALAVVAFGTLSIFPGKTAHADHGQGLEIEKICGPGVTGLATIELDVAGPVVSVAPLVTINLGSVLDRTISVPCNQSVVVDLSYDPLPLVAGDLDIGELLALLGANDTLTATIVEVNLVTDVTAVFGGACLGGIVNLELLSDGGLHCTVTNSLDVDDGLTIQDLLDLLTIMLVANDIDSDVITDIITQLENEIENELDLDLENELTNENVNDIVNAIENVLENEIDVELDINNELENEIDNENEVDVVTDVLTDIVNELVLELENENENVNVNENELENENVNEIRNENISQNENENVNEQNQNNEQIVNVTTGEVIINLQTGSATATATGGAVDVRLHAHSEHGAGAVLSKAPSAPAKIKAPSTGSAGLADSGSGFEVPMTLVAIAAVLGTLSLAAVRAVRNEQR